MRLSPEAIREFQAICRDEFGQELSEAEAERRAFEVLDFFWFLFMDNAVADEPAFTPEDVNFDRKEPQGLP